MSMTYEAYLDEVTTLITEKYNLEDDEAIHLVMCAQAADFFCDHDDNPALRSIDRAHQDARGLYRMRDRFPGKEPPEMNS